MKRTPKTTKRRYQAPEAYFPPATTGVTDLIAGIKAVFFKDCPEIFSLKIMRTRSDQVAFDPIPRSINKDEYPLHYKAPHVRYGEPNPYELR